MVLLLLLLLHTRRRQQQRAGATSNVFLAVHAATLKMVALKEVTVSNDADRWAVRTEMRALKTQRSPLLNSAFTTKLASCPRIVDYYGSVVRENGNACIAVEYVAGGSLESWLENSGASVCPEPWFAHIAHQALEVRRRGESSRALWEVGSTVGRAAAAVG